MGMIPNKLQPLSITSTTVGTSNSTGETCKNIIKKSMLQIIVRLLRDAIFDSPFEKSRAELVLAALAFIAWIINFWLSSAALLLIATSLATNPNPIGRIEVSKSNIINDHRYDNSSSYNRHFWMFF